MTTGEYIQLKAFARQDGALLSVLWIVSFICYIYGTTNAALGLAAIILACLTPFCVARRLRHFRDDARQGIISFRRGYAYAVLVFFYAGLLLALAQYVYFAYMDQGYLLNTLLQAMSSDEGRRAMEGIATPQQVQQAMDELRTLRPIDFALNMLTVNIGAGLLLGIPISITQTRTAVRTPQEQ